MGRPPAPGSGQREREAKGEGESRQRTARGAASHLFAPLLSPPAAARPTAQRLCMPGTDWTLRGRGGLSAGRLDESSTRRLRGWRKQGLLLAPALPGVAALCFFTVVEARRRRAGRTPAGLLLFPASASLSLQYSRPAALEPAPGFTLEEQLAARGGDAILVSDPRV